MDQGGADVNTMWETFKTTVMSAVEKHIPSTLCRRSTDLPWIGHHIKKLLRRKKRLYKQARKTGNWSNYRFFQKECRREMRKTEYQYVNRVIEEGIKGNNTRPFWRYVKARRQDNTGVAPLKKGTTLFSDSTTKAKILLDQFCSVFTKDNGSQLPKMESAPYPGLTDLVIKTEGVAKLLRNLNPAKVCGPDNIPSRILKECADTIAPALSCIFSRSVQTGQLPSDWLTANISSVFKKATGAKQRTIDQFHWRL